VNAVVSPHHLSAAAGQRVLLDGGNAVDAAIAVVAAQGVVAPETCGLGGDLFAIIHAPGWDRPRTLNSSGRAGSNVDANQMRADGLSTIPLDHPAVVTVPGCVDGLVALNTELGTRTLGECLQPAIDLAANGFEVSTEQGRAFDRLSTIYGKNPAVSDFYPDGNPVRKGDTVARANLADTLTRLANTGDRNEFYLGRAGEDISAAVGGLITMDDLAINQADWIESFGVDVFGLTAWTTPPNSQGYLGPATLAIFEMLDPPDDPDNPRWWHLLIEAYRCVAWERDELVTDPDRQPMANDEIFDRGRLGELAATITDHAGNWPQPKTGVSGTAYMCTADSSGMIVSIIQSNYRGLGSPFGAARSGFLFQDRGLGFNLTPGHPNELTPGRRPLHTLSPTLWTQGDQPRWNIGTRGGDIQPQLVAQMAARVVRHRQDPVAAQEEPRWSMNDFGPGSGSEVIVEPGIPPAVLADLRGRGHEITELSERQGGWGPVSVIGVDGPTRQAAADPRVDTTAALVF